MPIRKKSGNLSYEPRIYIYIYIYICKCSWVWKSDLTDKMKHSFFQVSIASILLYGCNTWTLPKWLEKKLDGKYTRMLRAILHSSWRQHPTKQQLYGHQPPITKTIQIRRAGHTGHRWRSSNELISDVLLRIPLHGRAKVGRSAWTYIRQLFEDTGVALRTCWKRWTIGICGEKVSGICVPMARQDNDELGSCLSFKHIWFF